METEVSQPDSTKLQEASRWVDRRFGSAKFLNKQLHKVFPDHWSFMLGEITLYCFVVLLVTGTYLTFFFDPSSHDVVYNGSYAPLRGTEMSGAFKSALDISFNVRAGLVMRQMHHWAALLFVAAMIVHLMRVFLTGAYRRPRELNWVIGVNILVFSMFNGFLGYSLLDDMLSATGLRVAYSLLLTIPFIGKYIAFGLFGGEFPGTEIIPRFYILHVLILPAVIIGLLSAHLLLVGTQKHTHHKGPGRTEDNVVGTRLYPIYLFKMVGLLFIVVAVIGALGGLAQINPVWVFGPFRSDAVVAAVTSASQPDWYMGWPDGVLRLVPGWETRIDGFTIPNPFWGGIVLPGVTFTAMMLWPFTEPRLTKDRKAHHLLDKPRDAPFRTGFGWGVFTFYSIMLVAESNDVLSTIFHVAPEDITRLLRVCIIVLPIIVFFVVRRICEELKGTTMHPAAPGANHVVIRNAKGGYEFSHGDHDSGGHDGAHGDGETQKQPSEK